MKNTMSTETKSWLISAILHILIITIFSVSFKASIMEEEKIYYPVELVLVKPKEVPKKVVKTKAIVTKKSVKKAIKKESPKSLPGDRIQPEVAKDSQPVYPKKALNNDWEGTVKVKVFINALGAIQRIDIINSSGYDVLDNSFIRSIKESYKFKPKRIMGKNTNGELILSYAFNLGGAL